MSQTQPFPEPDHNRAPQLLAVFWVPFPFMMAFVGARIMVRIKMRTTGIDDWLMVAAVIIQAVSLSLSSCYVIHGGARHIYYVDPKELEIALKYNFLTQPFAVAASACAKISVAMFLTRRIMGPVMIKRQRLLYANATIYALLSVVAVLLVFVQCKPTRALWEKVPGAKCWDLKYSTNVSITQAAFSSYFDFLLALLPITIIWGLAMSTSRKVGLSILLGLGVLGGICAAAKTADMNNLSNRSDYTWAIYSAFIWNAIEQALVIICGSVPTVKPIYDYFISNRPLDASRNTPASSSKRSGSSVVLKSYKKFSGNTTTVEGDDEEGKLWHGRTGNRQILVGNSYEVSSLGEVPTDHASTRESI